MAAVEAIKSTIGTPPATAGDSSRAAMTPTSTSPSPFARLRAELLECLRLMGLPGNLSPDGIVVRIGNREQPILFFEEPRFSDENVQLVYDTLRRANGPMVQKEVAKAAKICVRLASACLKQLRESGHVKRHPSLGFYLPGQIEE